MRKYTDTDFEYTLTKMMSKNSFYAPLVNSITENTPNCILKNNLQEMGLDIVWTVAVMHGISQHGPELIYTYIKDDALLNELFDWSSTYEGHGFWERIAGMFGKCIQ